MADADSPSAAVSPTELEQFEAWTYPPVGDGCDDCNLIRRLVAEIRRLHSVDHWHEDQRRWCASIDCGESS